MHETFPDKGKIKKVMTESQLKVTGWDAYVASHGSHGRHGIHGIHGVHGVHGSHGGHRSHGVHGSHGVCGVWSSGVGTARGSES